MVVPAAASGQRLDTFLASLDDRSLTRSAARRLCAEGRVTVDDRPAKPSHRLRGGERLEVDLPSPAPTLPVPQALGVPIVHVDEHLVVVDKPAGLVVHPAPGHPDGTLVNALLHDPGGLAESDDPARPGIVHRLDRDTSGLMVVARTVAVLEALKEGIRSRSVTRRYLLVVRNARRLGDQGTWDTAYGRNPRHRKRMTSRLGDRRAVTHWRRMKELPGDHALVEATLDTGRTHQIRVHFAEAGFPVLADGVYGRTDRLLSRQFLHAAQLGFQHPATGAQLAFEAPLPEDLAAWLRALREQ